MEENKTSNFQKLMSEVLLSLHSKEGKEINYISKLKREVFFKNINNKSLSKETPSFINNIKNKIEKNDKELYNRMVDVYSNTLRQKDFVFHKETKSELSNFLNYVRYFFPNKEQKTISSEKNISDKTISPITRNSLIVTNRDEKVSKIHFKINNFKETFSIENNKLSNKKMTRYNSMKEKNFRLNEYNPKVSIFKKNLNNLLLKNFGEYVPKKSISKRHNFFNFIINKKYRRENNFSDKNAILTNKKIEKLKEDLSLLENQKDSQNKKKDLYKKSFNKSRDSFFELTMDHTINKSEFNDKVTSFKKRMDLSSFI